MGLHMLNGFSLGTWIRDLKASTAPVGHQFYGTDINANEFPTDVPPGTTYQAQDITRPWPKDWEGQFDLVHQRLVLIAAGAQQKEAVQSLGALVKPGGWIQLIEAPYDLPDGCGPELHAFNEVMKAVFAHMGGDLDLAQRLPEWLEQDGFVDVQYRDVVMKSGAQNPNPELARRSVFSMTTACKGLSQFAKSKSPLHSHAAIYLSRFKPVAIGFGIMILT